MRHLLPLNKNKVFLLYVPNNWISGRSLYFKGVKPPLYQYFKESVFSFWVTFFVKNSPSLLSKALLWQTYSPRQ
jgi:hypothetical protein